MANLQVHHTNCSFPDYFCNPSAANLIDKIEDKAVLTAQECHKSCVGDPRCNFFTFFNFRGSPACYALESCNERVKVTYKSIQRPTRPTMFRNQLAAYQALACLDRGIVNTRKFVLNWIIRMESIHDGDVKESILTKRIFRRELHAIPRKLSF